MISVYTKSINAKHFRPYRFCSFFFLLLLQRIEKTDCVDVAAVRGAEKGNKMPKNAKSRTRDMPHGGAAISPTRNVGPKVRAATLLDRGEGKKTHSSFPEIPASNDPKRQWPLSTSVGPQIDATVRSTRARLYASGLYTTLPSVPSSASYFCTPLVEVRVHKLFFSSQEHARHLPTQRRSLDRRPRATRSGRRPCFFLYTSVRAVPYFCVGHFRVNYRLFCP